MTAANQMTMPGQEVDLSIDQATFKKDQNFVVVLEAELLKKKVIKLGDNINFHTGHAESKEWSGLGQVTHLMSCYLLDLPPFIMQKHQDPSFKNPMALYHHLQTRVGRLLTPMDKVISIGFKVLHTND